MQALSFESLQDLQDFLTSHGKRFNHWCKPVGTLFKDLSEGAARMWLLNNGNLLVEEHKVQISILANRPEGLQFLQEHRTFTYRPDFIPEPSQTTSISEKLFFCPPKGKPETIKQGLLRGVGEELRIFDPPIEDTEVFRPRSLGQSDECPRVSRTREGLLTTVTKHSFFWYMSERYQRQFEPEVTNYRISEFPWVEPSKKLLKEFAKEFGREKILLVA